MASLFSYWLSQRVDLNLYHYFRRFNLSEYTASAFSVSCSQALDTIVFSFRAVWFIQTYGTSLFLVTALVAIVLISFVALQVVLILSSDFWRNAWLFIKSTSVISPEHALGVFILSMV